MLPPDIEEGEITEEDVQQIPSGDAISASGAVPASGAVSTSGAEPLAVPASGAVPASKAVPARVTTSASGALPGVDSLRHDRKFRSPHTNGRDLCMFCRNHAHIAQTHVVPGNCIAIWRPADIRRGSSTAAVVIAATAGDRLTFTLETRDASSRCYCRPQTFRRLGCLGH